MRYTPLYAQLADSLLKDISEGRLRPGDRLPTEDEFASAHRVSRVTVRQALNLLRERGLVERFARRGSFISKQPKGYAWTARAMQDVVQFGAETVPKILEWRALDAPAVAERLQLPVRERIYRLRSVRSYLDRPVYYVEAYTPHDIGQRLHRADLRLLMLLEVIENKLGLTVSRAVEEISADVADAVLAKRLGIRLGSPVLVLEIIYFGVDDRPLEYAKVWYRADHVKRRNELVRNNGIFTPRWRAE